MYVLSDGHGYIGLNGENVATCVTNIMNALSFSEEKKAINYRDNLKSTLRRFDWQIVKLKEIDDEVNNKNNTYTYVETELEKTDFNISEFFNSTIKTISQLRDYTKNMSCLEQEYNKKILDVRHYIRDEKTTLNAIQMQRIGYFLQKLERERYECKSNRLIAEIFLSDFNRLENINCVDEIRNIKESKYNPKILTYEILDDIVGKKRRKIC